MKGQNLMEQLISICKQRGFIYQGSEIYGGLAGTWDYGPLGVELKNNLKKSWWKRFVHERNDMYGVDAAILMSSRVWEASGHVTEFHDPLVEDKKTKRRYRADHLLEENGVDPTGMTIDDMSQAIKDKGIKSPDGNELGDVKQFNMMFKTHVGAAEDTAQNVYLRPETAQGIFVNYKNILDSFHPEIPFGIAQIGKAFRNEITPRDFIFRVRELEQMEIEYFIRPEVWEDSFDEWFEAQKEWLASVGVDMKRTEEYEHPAEERSHYSDRTVDIEFEYPFGMKELTGLAYRTDYDLQAHKNHSNVNLEYRDPQTNEKFIPHVIEPTFGVDRLVLAILVSSYREEEVDGEIRRLFAFHPAIAPVQVAILPLMKKDGLAEKAMEVFREVNKDYVAKYDQTGSIGKRYRRQDEIGTPYCVTVDYDTLEDGTVTVRNRDTMEQERMAIADLPAFFEEHLK